jgi:L-seryl-tRNA(Ser) seleniumtransferase
MLTRSRADIQQACHRVAGPIAAFAGDVFDMQIADCASQIGSGALPEERLPSAAVMLRPKSALRRSGGLLQETLARFRQLTTPVIGRINDGAIIFDCRCLLPTEESLLIEALRQARP